MATIQQLKTQIQNANALGRTNLTDKGVELSATATTYDIMTAIAEIVGSSGSGIEYTNIVYNADNTVTLTDKDGVIHTMSCTYEDGKLIGVTYDGKAVDLTYNGDVLVKVGKTAVDVANAPVNIAALDHTVTFTVDGEPYEVVSVKNGNSVNAPTEPMKNGYCFLNWLNGEANVVFPFTPINDTELTAQYELATIKHELEYSNHNASFFKVDKYSFGKQGDVTCIAGCWSCIENENEYTYMVVVSKESGGTQCWRNYTPSSSVTSYNTPIQTTLNDEVWYYIVDGKTSGTPTTISEKTVNLNDYISGNNATPEQIALTLVKIYLGLIPLKN